LFWFTAGLWTALALLSNPGAIALHAAADLRGPKLGNGGTRWLKLSKISSMRR
jgi:hypothetical protein